VFNITDKTNKMFIQYQTRQWVIGVKRIANYLISEEGQGIIGVKG